MFVRICSAAILTSFLLGGHGAGQQVQLSGRRRPRSVPCSRFPTRAASSCGFARPIWSDAGRIPKAVCGCLHDYAAATVEDADLREALLRGISETGVPTIETAWVPPSKQSEIGPTFTKIAKPTLQCMFEPETSKP